MEIEDLLAKYETEIVDEATRTATQLAPYLRDGAPVTRCRIEALLRHLTSSVRDRDVTGLRGYVRQIAHERRQAGFPLSAIEGAFAALEDAIWHGAVARLPAYDRAFGHGLVCTALAHARDTLRHELDASSPHANAPYPDLTVLFKGAEPVLAPCPAEEIVSAA